MRDHRWIMGARQIAADTSDAENFIFRPLSAMKCKKETCLGMLCVIIAMCGFRRQGHSKLAGEGVGTHCVEPIADVGCG